MNYHKLASFWILLSYLAYTAYNPTTFICIGLLFPFALFAGEIYLDFVKTNKLLEDEKNVKDEELEELKLEHEKENIRASIQATRNQRAIQESLVGGGKKPNKDEFRW